MDDIAQQAISQALSGNWQKAYELNSEILKSSPDNTDAMVRSAKALMELGESVKAKKVIDSVLKVDPYHNIANKLLMKIKGARAAGEVTHSKVESEKFIEEPGKTKVCELTKLGDPNIIIQVDPGDEVKLVASGKTISVNTLNDKHLGRLPDDIGFRLKKLISQGFKFQAIVKSATSDCVKIFVREISRPEGYESINAFSIERLELPDNDMKLAPDPEDEY